MNYRIKFDLNRAYGHLWFRRLPGRVLQRIGCIGLWMLVIAAVGMGRIQAQPKGAEPYFTVVAMPDTQHYTETRSNAETYFKGQTQWIVQNQKKENIVFVCHLGDLQEHGNYLRLKDQPDPEQADLVARANTNNPPLNILQWQRASEAMRILDDADVPYVAVAGNHDFRHWEKPCTPEMFIQFFGPQRYSGKSWYGGFSPARDRFPAGMNSYQFFIGAGRKFLSIGLQFAPRAEDLAWAQAIINANPGMPTIITTHSYLNNEGIEKDRRILWDDLIRKNPQIFMTLNGHINGHNLVIEKNDAGLDVFEMLVDYQSLKVPGFYYGGGYMRLMRFCPAENRIQVKTYSPVTKNFLENPKDEFVLECNFAERFARHD